MSRLGIGDDVRAHSGANVGEGLILTVRSPIDGSVLAEFPSVSPEQVNGAIELASGSFPVWRDTPAPARGEFVRRIGNAFRECQDDLATLVAWEAGKIMPEARGEVQE